MAEKHDRVLHKILEGVTCSPRFGENNVAGAVFGNRVSIPFDF